MQNNELHKLMFETQKLFQRHQLLHKLIVRIVNMPAKTEHEVTCQFKRATRLVRYSKVLDKRLIVLMDKVKVAAQPMPMYH